MSKLQQQKNNADYWISNRIVQQIPMLHLTAVSQRPAEPFKVSKIWTKLVSKVECREETLYRIGQIEGNFSTLTISNILFQIGNFSAFLA